MKRESIDLSEERNLVTHAIVSSDYLREIEPILDPRFLQSDYAKMIIGWVKDYWERYKKAPGEDIQGIARQMLRTVPNEDTADNITEFLQSLSDAYEAPHNIQYAVSQGETYLRIRNLERLKKQIDQAVIAGQPDKGENALANFARVGRTGSGAIDILRDSGAIAQAFLDTEEYLFRFPGLLGEVIGDFARGDLVAFLAFSNKGKTWWQLWVAQLAALYGLDALFLSLEQPNNQLRRRAWQLVAGQPKHSGIVKIPRFESMGGDMKEIMLEEEYKEAPDVSQIEAMQKKLRLGYRGGTFRTEAMPAFATTYQDIETLIENLEYYEGYLPDVLVVDYADIIVPSGGNEYRHQLDFIWKSLRGLAQRKNILIVSATQSSRKGAKGDISEGDIAEDIRKLNHVSKLISLNQDKNEYEKGVMRVSQLKERDGRRDFREVGVLQCLDLGKPYIDSTLYKNVVIESNSEEE